MAFRDQHEAPALSDDPFDRFQALFAELDRSSGLLTDRVPLRLAAINLVTVPGDAAALAAQFYAHDAALARRLGWLTTTDPSVRRVIAAHLVKYGDQPDAFLDEVDRVAALFRAAGLRRGGVHETLAVLLLRRALGGAAIDSDHVARLAAIYAEMKRHHWWLTGPEDLPACAILVTRPGAPTDIGDGIEAIYQALHRDAGLWRGDPLQTAANVLYLSGLGPDEVAARFTVLVREFRQAGATIGQGEYDDLAILCFFALPVARIVATVIGYRDRLTAGKWFVARTNFSLATNLAFVRMVGQDGALGPLADAKLLLDMQAIVAARMAAVAGTTAATAAS